MAHVAMGSLHVTGAVAGQSIIEGRAITLNASGLHYDLPTALLAASGARNVFVAICPPDMLPRPTMARYFQYNPVTTQSYVGHEASSGTVEYPSSLVQTMVSGAYEYLVESGQSYDGEDALYLLGPSMMQEPVIASGWKVQAHRGGAYTLTANAFVDSAAVRNIGASIQVGSNGKFQYAESAIVGYVREYRDGKLTIVLDMRSGA